MGLWDGIKNIMSVSDDDYEEYEDEEVKEEAPPKAEAPVKKAEPKAFERKGKTVPFNSSNMEVVLFKPERFDEVKEIADSYCEKKTVILNLESANKDLTRRIIDFLSGVAYAKRGNLKKVAVSTFIIAPCDVDVTGEMLADEYDDARYYN